MLEYVDEGGSVVQCMDEGDSVVEYMDGDSEMKKVDC